MRPLKFVLTQRNGVVRLRPPHILRPPRAPATAPHARRSVGAARPRASPIRHGCWSRHGAARAARGCGVVPDTSGARASVPSGAVQAPAPIRTHRRWDAARGAESASATPTPTPSHDPRFATALDFAQDSAPDSDMARRKTPVRRSKGRSAAVRRKVSRPRKGASSKKASPAQLAARAAFAARSRAQSMSKTNAPSGHTSPKGDSEGTSFRARTPTKKPKPRAKPRPKPQVQRPAPNFGENPKAIKIFRPSASIFY